MKNLLKSLFKIEISKKEVLVDVTLKTRIGNICHNLKGTFSESQKRHNEFMISTNMNQLAKIYYDKGKRNLPIDN